MQSFKSYLESSLDIFGFEKSSKEEPLYDGDMNNKPMKQLDTELLVNYLSHKNLGTYKPTLNFMNEIQWGDQPGAIKLDIEPRMAVNLKKLGKDHEGRPRWLTKKLFQLNRSGFGGHEEAIAAEIYDQLQSLLERPLDAPKKEFDLDNLVQTVSTKMRRIAKPIFVYEGVKRIDDNNHIIVFSLRAHGLEGRDQQQIREVLTQLTFDEKHGTIRATNYKVSNKTGANSSWSIKPSDMDMYFFPSQDRDEIAEAIACWFKYY